MVEDEYQEIATELGINRITVKRAANMFKYNPCLKKFAREEGLPPEKAAELQAALFT